MHEKIKDIQNRFWKAYTDFKQTKDMGKYNRDIQEICKIYKWDEPLLSFCQNLAITWAPIIDGMKE